MSEPLDVLIVDDVKHPIFTHLENAFALLLRLHPELEESLRVFRLEIRFTAFLRTYMRRLNATPEEMAKAIGLSVEDITFRATHLPKTSFYENLTEEERLWIQRFLKHGTSVHLSDAASNFKDKS
jgi:hypothetical protein